WRNDLFDHEQFGGEGRGACHRPTAVVQNCRGAIVLPVVNNILQHIGIATLWHRHKEITRDARTAVRHTFRAQALLSAFNDGGLIEKDGGRPRAGLQDGDCQRSMPTAYVYDPSALPEAVGANDSSSVLPSHVGLVIIEDRRGLGGVVEIGEER